MKLARREKYFVTFLGCVFLLIAAIEFVINPFLNEKKRLENGAKEKEAALEQMAVMSKEYKALKKNSEELQKIVSRRKEGVTLFAFLEKEANQVEIKGHIEYMKPSVSPGTGTYKESMVEMKLNGITLKQLVDYLYRIESPEEVITVKRISIKENTKQTGYLDVILQVLTLE